MKRGFTLLELIVVIIIVGILASIAVPTYFRAVERGRSGEGLSLLGVLRSAQMRYYAQHGALTDNTTLLDVGYTTSKYFTFAVSNPEFAGDAIIANATRNEFERPIGYDDYVLSINVDGNITCTDSDACRRLGY